MKKLLMALLVTAMTVPAFAETHELVDPTLSNEQLAEQRGLIPADQLDEAFASFANGDESMFQRRPPRPGPGRPGPGRPGPGPGRPGPGRPGPGRPGPGRPMPPPHRPPPRQVMCEARDWQGYIYRAYDYDMYRARQQAMWQCERQTRSGRCQLLGCY